MPDLPIEIALRVLMVATFTCGGLLGLWAATSRWHWFVRAAVVLGVFSLLLLRPMFEPFLVLFVQVGTIALGVAIYSHGRNFVSGVWQRTWRQLPRFSLLDLFLTAPLVAVIAAIGVSAGHELEWTMWPVSVGFGFAAGATTLLAAWMVDSKLKWYWRSVAIGSLFALIGGLCIYAGKYVFWESTNTMMALTVFLLAALQALLFFLWHRVLHPRSRSARQNLRLAFSLLLFFAVAAFPAYVAWQLLNPLPIPPPPTPLADNAYGELIDLGKRLKGCAVLREYGKDAIDHQKLAAAVTAQASDYADIHALLQRPARVPTSFDDWPDIDVLSFRRQLARFLDAQALSALGSSDVKTSLRASLDGVRLASRFESGGTLTDWLTLIACRGLALENLYEILGELSSQPASEARQILHTEAYTCCDFHEMLHREQIWRENVLGWLGHLYDVLERIVDRFVIDDDDWSSRRKKYEKMHCLYTTLAQLFTVELAGRQFMTAHDRPPVSIAELVPNYLPALPIDPFDPNGQPLRYRRTDAGFLVYSVAADGNDDDGRPPPTNQYGGFDMDGDGDLQLDTYFAPDDVELNKVPPPASSH